MSPNVDETGRSRLIVMDAAGTPQARRLIARVRGYWEASTRPTFLAEDLDKLKATRHVGTVQAAWILVRPGSLPDHLGAVVATLVEHHVPVVITRWGDGEGLGTVSREGAVIAPASAGPKAVSAVLQTIWSLQPNLMDLRSEVALLRAHQGGLTDRIEHIDEELRLAAQLQREFLPTKLPQIEHAALDVLYRPASYVSGDIYDVTWIDEDHVGLFIADAVGHGVPAALMTMYIKRSLQTTRIDAGLECGHALVSPDTTIAKLNRDICRQQADHVRLATACYGVLNVRTMSLNVSRAGHPYPLLLHEDGSMETIEPEGAMLGIFENEVYETAEVQLAAGDRLVLFTDGFEVAFPERRGARRNASKAYIEVFRKLAVAGAAGDAIAWLSRLLDSQVGSLNQCDDLTALLLAVDSVGGVGEAVMAACEPMAGVAA